MPMSETAVIPLHSHWSDAEYDRERHRLRELYGDKRGDAAAKYDQALAVLFYRSGWTQEQLAKKEGKSQPAIVCALRFGRFLSFITGGNNSEIAPNLTERSFRAQWEKTRGDERDRFKQVAKIFAEAEPYLRRKPRPKIGQDIVAQFADGKWHRPETIAKAIEADTEHVIASLENMYLHGVFKTNVEKRHIGRDRVTGDAAGWQYRIHRRDQTISLDEISSKLSPLIEDLKKEARRPPGTGGGAIIGGIAQRIQNLLDAWAE
jgi:hypothetical protein